MVAACAEVASAPAMAAVEMKDAVKNSFLRVMSRPFLDASVVRPTGRPPE
jgi:hypothetical protein